jgi:Tfp pilus assembly PilM family ATPase
LSRFLAIDWDQNQLHIIAADVAKGSVKVKKAVVWQEPQIPSPANAEDLGKLLKDRLREAGIQPAPVLACVGRDRLIVKEIRFPPVPETEEPAIVRFQAVKELTEAPDDVVIDYVVTGNAPSGERKAAAIVVRKEILDTYRSLCESAGLKLVGLTPRLMGAATTLRKVMGTTVLTPLPNPPDGVVAVVLLAEKSAEISILQGQTILLARSLTNSANLATDVRRSLAVHAGQMPHLPVSAVYLTGRGSGELRQRLGELVEVPVYTFDPFAWASSVDVSEMGPARIRGAITPAELLDEADGARPAGRFGTFAGAMGLLFLESAGALPVNFVSPRQPRPQANPNYRLIRLALVASVALFLGLFVLGRVLHASWSDELSKLKDDSQRLEQQLTDTRTNGKRLKEIDDWDNVVWLDFLYDLNAVIPDVNALRITSVVTEPLPRTAKSKAAAKATIKGKLLGRGNLRKPFDQLVDELKKDGYYSIENLTVVNDTFSLTVVIERRAPGDYKYQIKEEAKSKTTSTSAKGETKRKSADKNDDTADAEAEKDDKAEKKEKSKAGNKNRGGNKGGKRRPGGE